MSYLRCLCIVAPNTYCVLFLFCFSSSFVPYVASFSGLSIFDCSLDILQRLLDKQQLPVLCSQVVPFLQDFSTCQSRLMLNPQ
jgi:hypothetical protein